MAEQIHDGRFGKSLSAWTASYRAAQTLEGKTPEGAVPLTLHIYNDPFLSCALIDAVQRFADENHARFDLYVTEIQIEGLTYKKPSPERLAECLVSLGGRVVDEVARSPRLSVKQLIAFSWHHVNNKPGQDFGLRGHQALQALTGDDPTV